MDELILNEFYNKILPAIRDDNLKIDGWNFNIEFQTLLNDNKKYTNYDVSETLIISDIDLFNQLLVQYTKKMIDIILNSSLKNIDYVYYNGNKTYIIDFIISNLWNNVTDMDLINPINFLRMRINFLDDTLYDKNSKIVYLTDIDFLEYSNIEYEIKLNNPILETPYSFSSYIVRDRSNNEVFKLPEIFYGISEGICYIYAIQRIEKVQKNEYTKKVNRILYRVNKEIYDDYALDNIKDVTPSALVSLTIFIKKLKEININDIRVIDYMPIRYKAKEKAIDYRVNKFKDKVSQEEFRKIEESAKEEHYNIQTNITDKFMRNFRRLEYQLGDVHIVNFPKDVDSMMHIRINNNTINNDNILNRLYCYNNIKRNKL
ncbi:MAG: hypothetical protein J6J17_01830 [Bacilli bacterium]|nr:hypothetical protein [Bacilli bacterium]